jgi:diguanylate cyclase (GGDEF)-like protein
MELLGLELLALLIAYTLLYYLVKLDKREPIKKKFGLKEFIISFVFYLTISILDKFLPHSLLFTKLEYISVLFVILIWIRNYELYLYKSNYLKNLYILKIAVLVTYSLVIIFVGYELSALLVASTIYFVISLLIILKSRYTLEGPVRIIVGTTLLFTPLSLAFFVIFSSTILITLGGAFTILITYFYVQQRRLETDFLTTIPNQNALLRYLERKVKKGLKATVIVVDIENFRQINVRYGLEHGDRLLVNFATFLSHNYEKGRVYRVAGNRFAILLPIKSHNEIVKIVDELQQRSSEGWSFGNLLISFHLNIAIIEIPIHAVELDQIIEVIDFTIQEIKQRRRQSVLIFNEKMRLLQQRYLDVLTAIKNSLIDQSRIIILFQPIYGSYSGKISGAEVLMRLKDPILGLISPFEFIPIAEQSGLITSLTKILTSKVATLIKENADSFSKLEYVSINVTSDDLSSVERARSLINLIKESGINPHKIGIEVTESMLIVANKNWPDVWKMFNDEKIRLMLDDFGTGYSNLETLIEIPFDVIKIDRSIVSSKKNNYQLINLLAPMLHKMDKKLVAEGIETLEQVKVVQSLNIEYMQGYFFSQPLSKEDFLALLQSPISINFD